MIADLLSALALLAGAPQDRARPDPAVAQAAPALPVEPRPRHAHAQGDPLEGFNRHMYRIHIRFDHAIFRPVALGYKHVVPKFIRSALRHFFSNLDEPIVFVNYLLQHRVGKAAETLARFTINSTYGVAGTIDVAKVRRINLPHRPNGFGDTLGFYGVKPGPYLFIPFGGPTTLRDLFGSRVDGVVLPLAVSQPFADFAYNLPRAALTGLDQRAESDGDFNALLSSAVDPYATLRSVYLQDRAAEIAALHRRNVLNEGAEIDPLADPAAKPATEPPATPAIDPLTDPAPPPSPAPVPTPPPPEPAAAPVVPARI